MYIVYNVYGGNICFNSFKNYNYIIIMYIIVKIFVKCPMLDTLMR